MPSGDRGAASCFGRCSEPTETAVPQQSFQTTVSTLRQPAERKRGAAVWPPPLRPRRSPKSPEYFRPATRGTPCSSFARPHQATPARSVPCRRRSAGAARDHPRSCRRSAERPRPLPARGRRGPGLGAQADLPQRSPPDDQAADQSCLKPVRSFAPAVASGALRPPAPLVFTIEVPLRKRTGTDRSRQRHNPPAVTRLF